MLSMKLYILRGTNCTWNCRQMYHVDWPDCCLENRQKFIEFRSATTVTWYSSLPFHFTHFRDFCEFCFCFCCNSGYSCSGISRAILTPNGLAATSFAPAEYFILSRDTYAIVPKITKCRIVGSLFYRRLFEWINTCNSAFNVERVHTA